MSTCPFDDLFSGAVSVHSMVPELHKLKLEVSLSELWVDSSNSSFLHKTHENLFVSVCYQVPIIP